MPDLKIFKKNEKQDNNETNGKKAKKEKKGLIGKPRGKLPSKTTINLALSQETSVSPKRLLPVIIIAVLATLILSKFFIFDRINSVIKASNEISDLQDQLQSANAQIATYGDVEDAYAHYTYSGMTEEELGLVDRVDIMKLVEKVLGTGDTAKNWSLSGNILTIQMSGTSLRELNELARSLENEIIVDRCMITTANKTDNIDTSSDVYATFVIYLQKPTEQNVQQDQSAAQSIDEGKDQLADQITNGIADTVTDQITEHTPQEILDQGGKEIGGDLP